MIFTHTFYFFFYFFFRSNYNVGINSIGSSNYEIPEVIGDGRIVIEEGENFEKRFAGAIIDLFENPIDSNYLREKALEYS